MESKDILEILNEFKEKDTYKKILINGKFGMGKSLYANQFLNNNENVIYISLFGKDDLGKIENEISHELLKKLGSKEKYFKTINKSLKNVTGSISFLGITINSPTIIQKSFIEEFHTILEEKNLIILLDDFERKSSKLPIEDLLGVIEQLSLYKTVKIALIGDESKFSGEDLKIWNSFKEKIIEKEYNISVFSNEAINSYVISELNKYIDECELSAFVNDFVYRFPVNNLRVIKKGVKLFLEIVNTHLKVELKDVNLILLKTCLAVAIEKAETLAVILEKGDNIFLSNSSLDCDKENIETKIEMCYFKSSFSVNKEASLIHYVLSIYEGTYTQHMIEELNQLIEKYLITKKEKDIFYLNEEKIKQIVIDKYDLLINNQYEYTCLEEFIDDILNILEWYNVFEIEYDEEKLKEIFIKVLFENYYNKKKSFTENIINRFSVKIQRNLKFKSYLNEYNQNVEDKYYEDKLEELELSFKTKEFDTKKIEWLKQVFIQKNKEYYFESFIKRARENKYFFVDMSGEISEKGWGWSFNIWKIVCDYMPSVYRNEINEYINSLKDENKLENLRISFLQEYGLEKCK